MVVLNAIDVGNFCSQKFSMILVMTNITLALDFHPNIISNVSDAVGQR